jgi:phenylacetate-CoA ligase
LLLEHAYTNVPLYRRMYDEAGFKPDHFRSLDDVKKIPVLQKSVLKAAAPLDVLTRGTDPSRCSVVCTSGSTGVPLKMYFGPFETQWQRAVAWRILFEHGYQWTDRTLEIRMNCGQPQWIQKLGIAAKDWLSILDSPISWARCLAKRKHQIIVASATTLGALAEAVESSGLEIATPRLIVSDSETLAPSARALVRRVLKRDPIDVFGLVEVSNFAWECGQRNGFHVSADSHLVEVDAPPAEVGPMIVTDLQMRTMPIIRYECGDMAQAIRDGRTCGCGRTLPIIPRIFGRAIDSVVLPDNRRLFWPFFHEILGARDELLQWRVTQTAPREIRLQLALLDQEIERSESIAAEIRRQLPHDVELVTELVERFEYAPNQKVRQVISLLKPNVN